MKFFAKIAAVCLLYTLFIFALACGSRNRNVQSQTNVEPTVPIISNAQASPTPQMPNLQAEILDDRYKKTDAPIGKIDFTNFTYPFPRGWQDIDSREFTLDGGKRPMSEDKIGVSYLTTKFFDVTGDGEDEAFVILKIETAGSAIPQIVYIFTMKDNEPELIWHFRTGDRADGGLKDIRPENGEVVVEIYGQDRYILGEGETMKITGDEEQICCPTHFTRTRYKWNGNNFPLQGKRLTFSTQDLNLPPVENKAEILEREEKKNR